MAAGAASGVALVPPHPVAVSAAAKAESGIGDRMLGISRVDLGEE